MDNKNLQQLLKIKALLAGQPQKFDDGGQVQPKPTSSPSAGPSLDPKKTKEFQEGFNSGGPSLAEAYANAKKSLGFADGGQVVAGAPADLAPYMPTPQEEEASGFPPGPQRALYIAQKKKQAAEAQGLAKGGLVQRFDNGGQAQSLSDLSADELQALLSKNSDSASDSASTDALVNAKTPTDDGFDALRSKLNALSDSSTNSGVAAANDAGGSSLNPQNPTDLGKIPLPNGGLTGDALASFIAKNPGPGATTGLNPANPGLPLADRALAAKAPVAPSDDSNDDDEDETPAQKLASAAKGSGGKLLDNTNPAPDDANSATADLLKQLNSAGAAAKQANDPFDAQALKDAQSHDKTVGGIFGALFGPEARQVVNQNGAVAHLQQQQQVSTSGIENQLKKYSLADEKEKNDPNSSVSALARNVLQASAKQAGFQVGDVSKMSASSIEKTAPWVAKIIDSKMSADTRAQVAEQNRLMREQMMGNKQDQKDEQTAVNLQKQLDSSGPRAGNFGKAGAMSMAADRINAILQQFPDGNIPKAQTEELAMAQAAMVNGGSAQSQQSINAVTPQSMVGNTNALAGWLFNDPKGLGQQKFIKQLADSANREKAVADQQMNDIKIQRLGAYNDYANRHPENFSRIIKSAGLNPDLYDMKSGEYKREQKAAQQAASRSPQATGYSPTQEAGIQAVMQGNGVDRDTAVAALKKAGKL